MPYADPEKARAYRREWKKSPEQRAKAAKRARERYAEDSEFRERNKAAARRYQQENPLSPEEVEKRNKKNAKLIRASQLRRLYGITVEDYQRLFAKQKGCCAICGSKEPRRTGRKHLCVDHCHETGKVRGLLCDPCNNGFGRFGDDPQLLKRAVAYLERYDQKELLSPESS
jgi:hypothetical protein